MPIAAIRTASQRTFLLGWHWWCCDDRKARKTRSSAMARRLNPTLQGDHDALHDALYQAELFRLARGLIKP